LLDEVLRYPDVPPEWRTRDLSRPPSPLLTVVFRNNDRELRFFSTITTFVTPRDFTVEHLGIDCAFPADQATPTLCHALAAEDAVHQRPNAPVVRDVRVERSTAEG
jgi:hypothetical protein